jgi:uncharacterized protein YjiS (DUF1127 family)
MDARITKAEAALLLPAAAPTSRRMAEIEALRLAAIAARDEAIANAARKALRSIGRGVAALLRAVAAFHERLATFQALNALTDRELRDIGMNRYDVSRIFEPGFTPRPANDAGERPAPRAA